MLHAPFDMPTTHNAYVMAADPRFLDEGEAAMAGAGYRLSGCGDGRGEALDRFIALDLLYLDLRGADPLLLSVVADRAMAARARFDAALVVRFDSDQMDAAFAAFEGSGAELLCDPSPIELAVILTLGKSESVGSRVRETDDEAERLKRLNDEVARIAETLARLVKHEAPPPSPAQLNERSMAYRPAAEPELPTVSAIRVRNVIRARRLRDQYFPTSLFADPAWDMLLDLFAAELEHVRVSVSSLCIAAAVPPTTALRWITSLTSHELIEREPDPLDRRRAHLKLTARAGIAMRGYFNALERMGLIAP